MVRSGSRVHEYNDKVQEVKQGTKTQSPLKQFPWQNINWLEDIRVITIKLSLALVPWTIVYVKQYLIV